MTRLCPYMDQCLGLTCALTGMMCSKAEAMTLLLSATLYSQIDIKLRLHRLK